MGAPLYKREDVVYRRSGAEIGRLEAFKIAGSRQISNDVWEYEVIIYQRPPNQPTIGDRVQSKLVEPRLYFLEAELITLCEAVQVMIARLETQLRGVENIAFSECNDPAPDPEPGAPRFNIDDRVWLSASARIGFFETDIVVSVKEIGIQPGSKSARYAYQLQRTTRPSTGRTLIFREDELITKCEAVTFILAALNRQLAEALALQQTHCVS